MADAGPGRPGPPVTSRPPGAASLDRAIRLPHATALVVGTIIGVSIFVQPAEVTGQIPSVGGALLVWVVAGVLTLFGAIVTAELASLIDDTGGVYVFLREAFSPLLGFLWGWAMFWTMHTGIIAAISVAFARYIGWFLPLDDFGLRLVAVAAIAALSWLNYAGVRQGTRVQTAITVIKVGAIGLMVAAALALGPAGDPGATALGGASNTAAGAAAAGAGAGAGGLLGGGTFGHFLSAVAAGLFAFGGWHMVTYSAGETIDPKRTIPRSLLIGIGIVTAAYVLLNLAYFYVLPLETAMSSERIAADAADAVLGGGGAAFMAGLVIVSSFGGLTGIILAGPRVYQAMAADGLFLRWAAEIHPARRTPHRAIFLQAIWASVLVMTASYRTLFTLVIYTEWIFFGLMAIGLLLLRRRVAPDTPLVARWAWPWAPFVFAVCAFAIAANAIVADPRDGALGLGLVIIGAPVYWLATRGGAKPGDSHS
ncbi:MAG: amino acid permease [Gemmatimonadota bacterium]|nr:amino acid permease [Gemmatimonadota bacterium]